MIVGCAVQERVQTTGFIKEHLMQLLSSKATGMKQRVAVSLAHLLQEDDLAKAYSSYGGADVLLDLVCDIERAGNNPRNWTNAIEALQQVLTVCASKEKARSTEFVPIIPDEKVRLG